MTFKFPPMWEPETFDIGSIAPAKRIAGSTSHKEPAKVTLDNGGQVLEDEVVTVVLSPESPEFSVALRQ